MRSERKVSASVNNFVVHRLREIRVERGLKAREVARRAGISPGSFGCLENGFYRINLENLFKILQVLDAPVEQVWPQADRPSKPIDRAYLEQAVEQAVERVPRPGGAGGVALPAAEHRARGCPGVDQRLHGAALY